MLGLQIVRITDCRISDSLEKALKPPKSHVLRSGSSVHQHELLAVRKPTFRDFFCKRGRDVGKYVGECGERKGCWEGGKFFGQYLGKSGDFRLRILPMFF